ncbi:TrkH-domain-containing protein [Tilletiaria anomala UBC 951]|uniref:TrkH-domain-containing protein n=1 Tax=Tilletiaria anomala (strain ATCC 24038 / CBS 436.72 / UBC 951) TaxID=1037660 RepID=A0A066W882_TILAU|nr:TrkH-domain-containing protein [Tilletiaria anomala UBC 951]KDN49926.1 TrkH-domain-containing protein [Tilletiaria anomala UBC 951]
MSSLRAPSFLQRREQGAGRRLAHSIRELAGEHLNFYRVHVLFFVFTPLILSGIFYAANGAVHIKYIDCLFCVVSAITVTGLATVNISNCTAFQQAILFLAMVLGNLTTVSLTMVWVRRYFFRRKFDQQIRTDPKLRRRAREAQRRIWAERQMGIRKVQQLLSGRLPNGSSSKRKGSNGEEEKTAAARAAEYAHEKGLPVEHYRERHQVGNAGKAASLGSVSSSDVPEHTPQQPQQQQSKKERGKDRNKKRKGPLTAAMIRRADQPAVLMNPSIIPDSPHLMRDRRASASTGAGGLPASASIGGLGNAPSGSGILSNRLTQEPEEIDLPTGTSPTAESAGAGAGTGSGTNVPSVRIALPHSASSQACDANAGSKTLEKEKRLGYEEDAEEHDDLKSDRGSGAEDDSAEEMSYMRAFQRSAERAERARALRAEQLRRNEQASAQHVRTHSADGHGMPDVEAAADSSEGVSAPHYLRASRSTASMTQNRPGVTHAPQHAPQLHPQQQYDPLRRRARRGSEGAYNFNTGTLPRHAPPLATFDPMPRAQTIGFAEPVGATHRHSHGEQGGLPNFAVTATNATFGPGAGGGAWAGSAGAGAGFSVGGPGGLRHRPTGLEFERTATRRSMMTQGSYRDLRRTRTSMSGLQIHRTMSMTKNTGFGGWPTPVDFGRYILNTIFHRSQVMPRTSTLASTHSLGGRGLSDSMTEGVRTAPYFSFDVLVSRNSQFHQLTEEQRDELGGVEYQAIDLLSKIIPAYILFVNFFFIILNVPYANSKAFQDKYGSVFEVQGTHAPNWTWYWFFANISAYTNTGMSLIDTSMTQQQDAYLPLTSIAMLILLGNTAFPIALRLFIWVFSKLTPSSSRTHESLRFLLDHPRRCFVYLFPSSQTWFLLFILCMLNVTDWVMFLLLDIGNPIIEAIPVGQRIFDGLVQGVAVRAAGWQVVSILTLAPAVQTLFVIMMYLSAFPIAMSVRSTNVYEEKSLGIFEDVSEKEEEPNELNARVWSRYLASHARRQLAFDMWWLGLALWLLCIVQRDEITDPASNGWFTVFSCLFELTSAYGTVGLSTGTPSDAFSLSGRFNTLGKLIVIAVMLRGRHRGLPVAIDRAILLPGEVEVEDESAWSMPGYPTDVEEGDQEGVGPYLTTGITRPSSTQSLEAVGPGPASTGKSLGTAEDAQGGFLRQSLTVISEGATPGESSENPMSRQASKAPEQDDHANMQLQQQRRQDSYSSRCTSESKSKSREGEMADGACGDANEISELQGMPVVHKLEETPASMNRSSGEGQAATSAGQQGDAEEAMRQRFGSDPYLPIIDTQ